MSKRWNHWFIPNSIIPVGLGVLLLIGAGDLLGQGAGPTAGPPKTLTPAAIEAARPARAGPSRLG